MTVFHVMAQTGTFANPEGSEACVRNISSSSEILPMGIYTQHSQSKNTRQILISKAWIRRIRYQRIDVKLASETNFLLYFYNHESE